MCRVETGEERETVDADASYGEVEEKKEEEVIDSTHANPYLDTNMNRKVCDNSDGTIGEVKAFLWSHGCIIIAEKLGRIEWKLDLTTVSV